MIKSSREMDEEYNEQVLTQMISKYFSPSYKFYTIIMMLCERQKDVKIETEYVVTKKETK